jgi:hypothetical protein
MKIRVSHVIAVGQVLPEGHFVRAWPLDHEKGFEPGSFCMVMVKDVERCPECGARDSAPHEEGCSIKA